MRKLMIAAMAAGLLAVAGPALADTAGTGETDNNVDCNASNEGYAARGPIVGGVWFAAAGDAEAPESGGTLVLCVERGNVQVPEPEVVPLQGRIIVSGDSGGGYVAADGDEDNEEAEQLQGWARVDVNDAPGVTCGTGDAAAEDRTVGECG